MAELALLFGLIVRRTRTPASRRMIHHLVTHIFKQGATPHTMLALVIVLSFEEVPLRMQWKDGLRRFMDTGIQPAHYLDSFLEGLGIDVHCNVLVHVYVRLTTSIAHVVSAIEDVFDPIRSIQ